MSRFFAKAYAAFRRVVRSVVKRSPVVDRSIGDLLRRIERRLPTGRVVEALASDTVAFRGFRLAFPKHDVDTVATILLHGDYEPDTRSTIETVLGAGMTFVDLGANIGIFTLVGARCVGRGGRVFAFEPAPAIMRFLERNVRDNGFSDVVTLVPSAVSERSGVVRFAFTETYSVGAHIADDGERGSILEVPATSLDEFFANAGWPSVHLIKMDVEGAELAVLRGMREVAKRNPRLGVIFEVLAGTFEGDSPRLTAFFETLRQLGFDSFSILHRDGAGISLPGDLAGLMALARRTNLNVLATRAGPTPPTGP